MNRAVTVLAISVAFAAAVLVGREALTPVKKPAPVAYPQTNMVDSREPCDMTKDVVVIREAYVKVVNPSRVFAVGCGMDRDFQIKRLTLSHGLEGGTYPMLRLTVAK